MRIAVWAGSGIGGTEKAATEYACGLALRGYQIDFISQSGPRTARLEKAGAAVLDLGFDQRLWAHYFERQQPDLVHQHVPGYPMNNPIYGVLNSLGSRRPRLIETNVFGRLDDPVGSQLVDYRLFISRASAAQAFRRAGRRMKPADLRNQTVVYYPVESPPVISPAARMEFRRTLGVSEQEVLALRIGQPGGTKWSAWECQALAQARRKAPQLRLFLMEPSERLRNMIAAERFGAGILTRRATSDFAWLQQLYRAADMMIHASNWGESFGYTVAEAMAAALPVVVRTTPWGDNAQVELVETGRTGFVCGSVAEMSRRLIELTIHSENRRKLGQAAQARILQLAGLGQELDVLEAVISHGCAGRSHPLLEQRATDLLAFAGTFPQREWSLSEPGLSHPIDYGAARLYALYRQARVAARLRIRQWRKQPLD